MRLRLAPTLRAWLLVVLAACGGETIRGEGALRELEVLAFVPAGECPITWSFACANERPLLVDRYETTREAWLSWLEGGGVEPSLSTRAVHATWNAEDRNFPASFMDLSEARAYARSRGMRVPTACEWIRIASGTRRQPWPWGYGAILSAANTLDLGLRSPVAAGTFELGRTPLGTYDMIGNVAEWVEDRVPPVGDGPQDGSGWVPDGLGWVMGGSYLSRLRPLHAPDLRGELRLFHEEVDVRHRAIDIGLRCVTDAEEYLWSHAPSWGEGASARARLVAVGREWGRAAVPLLEALSARAGAPPGLAHLLDGARG